MKFYTTSKISENMHETPEGYLVCVGVAIARTGEMIYGPDETPLEVGPDGKVIVRREADEVFRPETIASFEGKSVTILHPTDFVDPKNWANLTKGVMQNVRQGEGDQKDDLIADLLITDSEAINLVKNGLREVSCGYEAEYTQTGEGRGLQTKIIGNHLALVEQGRAGSTYAINDHKGKGLSMKLKEKIRTIFAKAQDEAMKVADEAGEGKKDDAKKDDAKDGDKSYSMDDVMQAVKDLGEKVAAFGKKDDSKDADKDDAKKDDAKDDDKKDADKKDDSKDADEGEESLSDRLKKLEAAVAKLLESKAEASDEDAEGEADESEDDDFEESTMTGDTASRMEILAPGFKSKAKDAKFQALATAYKTKDGKIAIDQISGGKLPAKDSPIVDTIFIAASELLKVSRASELGKTKTRDASDVTETAKGPVTAEMLNEINAKHYGKK